ncbi:hypothetical protein FIBSPDRAFT_502391 [Athelia psychrophila]|uniref:Uncharacterized protein n=1 Tax=Athelia psychrophila TaxID=1759441 RepID=A0A166K3X7_9AGAM|nr:hypothetical protein FIBSPDRAFT_502391 [Fibularhizoctonia sp. CBS 109695]
MRIRSTPVPASFHARTQPPAPVHVPTPPGPMIAPRSRICPNCARMLSHAPPTSKHAGPQHAPPITYVHAPATKRTLQPHGHLGPRTSLAFGTVAHAHAARSPNQPRTRAAPMRGCHHPCLLPQRTRRERSMSHAPDAAKPRDGSLTAALLEKKAVPVILCIIIGDACSCTVSWHRRGPYALLSTGDHGVQFETSSTTQSPLIICSRSAHVRASPSPLTTRTLCCIAVPLTVSASSHRC